MLPSMHVMRLFQIGFIVSKETSILSVRAAVQQPTNQRVPSTGLEARDTRTEGVDLIFFSDRTEKERQHLDRATPAISPRNHTHVLVHWESCLQVLKSQLSSWLLQTQTSWPEQPLCRDQNNHYALACTIVSHQVWLRFPVFCSALPLVG